MQKRLNHDLIKSFLLRSYLLQTNPVPTISSCAHQSRHGDSLREGNEPITSLLVVGDCPRL